MKWIFTPWGRMKTYVLNAPAEVKVEDGGLIVCADGRCLPVDVDGIPWRTMDISWTSSQPCTVKILEVFPGRRLSDQRHQHRSEQWTVLTSTAVIKLETPGSTPRHFEPPVGECLAIPAGTWHRLGCRADTIISAKILEISTGNFTKEDIERRSDDFGRK